MLETRHQSERCRHYQPATDWSHAWYTRTSSWWWRRSSLYDLLYFTNCEPHSHRMSYNNLSSYQLSAAELYQPPTPLRSGTHCLAISLQHLPHLIPAPTGNFSRFQRSFCCQRLMPDFQRSVSVGVTVAVAVSAKNVSVQAVYAVAAGACARQ